MCAGDEIRNSPTARDEHDERGRRGRLSPFMDGQPESRDEGFVARYDMPSHTDRARCVRLAKNSSVLCILAGYYVVA